MQIPATTDELGALVDRLTADALVGHPVVVITDILANARSRVQFLLRTGVEDILVVSVAEGSHPLDAPVQSVVAGRRHQRVGSMTDEIREWRLMVTDPPQHLVDAINRFDPDRRALVLSQVPFPVQQFLGRRGYGGRKPRYAELEDKTLSLEMWQAAGIRCAAEQNAPADFDSVWQTHQNLDVGAGTVWSADASDGFNGGSDLVSWVRTREDAESSFELIGTKSRQVRVMPFLEGVPCSIHGIVLDDGVIVLRPVELVILRPRDGSLRFVYAGISTGWDPPGTDRQEMRQAAERVGQLLARRHRYRGAFSIDGLLTEDGFMPNELNPRFSRGLAMMDQGMPALSLERLHDLAMEHIELGVPAEQIEATVLAECDHTRQSLLYAATADARADAETLLRVTWRAGQLSLNASTAESPGALEPAEATGWLRLDPALQGNMIRLDLDETPPDLYVAPMTAQALRLADERWGTDFGDLHAAPQMR